MARRPWHRHVHSLRLSTPEYDFETIFAVGNVDMLCVFGGGRYPAINHEDDTTNGIANDMVNSGPGLQPTSVDLAIEVGDNGNDTTELLPEEEPMLSFEDQLENNLENRFPIFDERESSSPPPSHQDSADPL